MPSPLHVAMLATDANEGLGFTHHDTSRSSPVLHAAVETLLGGLSRIDELEVSVFFPKRYPEAGDARQEGNIRFVPVPYQPVGFGRLRSNYLGRALALTRAISRLSHGVVHAQGTEREAGLVASHSRLPSLITLHGNMTEIARTIGAKTFSYFGIASRLERHAVARATGVHCISRHAERSMQAIARKTWVIPNAVSPSFFRIRRDPSPTPLVACISDIAEWKDPLVLVAASDFLHERFPGAEMHFLGSCNASHPYGKAFQDLVSARPWCVFRGKTPKPEVGELLARATCLVLPSRQENFGLALAEAMAAGVPCIGSDAGGIPELVEHGKTGLVFPAGNAEHLARLLIQLHSEPGLADTLGRIAKEAASLRFDTDAVARAHAAVYRELSTMPR